MSRFHSPAVMSASSSSCSTGRTCTSALLFAVPDTAATLHDEARKVLACQDIVDDEETFKRLDDAQRRQLKSAGERATRDLKEAVWRTYRYVLRRDHVRRLVLRPARPEPPLPGRFMVGPGRGDRPDGPVHRRERWDLHGPRRSGGHRDERRGERGDGRRASSRSNIQPKGVRWQGNVPPQKWMNFCTKVLSRFASTPGLRLTVSFEVLPESSVTRAQIEETRTALRELGLEESLEL